MENITTELDVTKVHTSVPNLPASALLGRAIGSMLSQMLKNELPRLELEFNRTLKDLLNTEFSNYNLGLTLHVLRTHDKLVRRASIIS